MSTSEFEKLSIDSKNVRNVGDTVESSEWNYIERRSHRHQMCTPRVLHARGASLKFCLILSLERGEETNADKIKCVIEKCIDFNSWHWAMPFTILPTRPSIPLLSRD